MVGQNCTLAGILINLSVIPRLAPVLKTIFHQCVIPYNYSQSYSDGSVLKQSHQSKTGYKYMIDTLMKNGFKDWSHSGSSLKLGTFFISASFLDEVR